MPLDEPVDTVDEAVTQLRSCDSTELRRARKHHRRALESLEDGGYHCLSEATRERLVARLRANLEALNRALDPSPAPSSEAAPPPTETPTRSFTDRCRAFFRGLW